MSNDTELRKLHIDILLSDRGEGWDKSTGREALAYRKELEAMPSFELEQLANDVAREMMMRTHTNDKLVKQKIMYERWARKPYWLQKDAVPLVLGLDPECMDCYETEESEDLNDLIARAVKVGQLKRELDPASLLSWLRDRKVRIPDGLSTAVQALQPTKPVPPTLKSEAPPRAAALTPAVNIPGYNCTPELQVALEAAQKFWANADPARPPKKDEEILPWLRERVDSDSKANAIDLIIRPAWARAGGNKKQSKG